MKRTTDLRRLTLAAVFVAISVVGSLFSVPVFGAKCAPIQHLMNIMGAVFLGPGYAVAVAFVASLIRNMVGLGTLLAFPGSMCGALVAGILYRFITKLPVAYIGEVVGTGFLGGILAYPVAALLLHNEQAAIFTFVIPFLISTCGGAVMAIFIVTALKRSGVMDLLLAEHVEAGK